MGKKRLLRYQQDRCRERLQALETTVDLRQVATIRQLCDALAAHRRRPIYVEAFRLPPSVYGVCLNTETTDYIFYAEDAAPPLQEHIILHEVAHVLLGLPEAAAIQSLVERLLKDLNTGMPRPALPALLLNAALKRTCYDEVCEWQAELLGTLIEQRWRALRRHKSSLLPQLQGTPDLRWLSEQAGDVE